MSKLKLATTLAFCVLLTPAFAQSLAEREARRIVDNTIQGYVGSYAGDCNVAVKIDWSTFKDGDAKALVQKSKSPAEFCKFALDAVGQVCRKSSDAKKALQSNVKSVTCKQASPSTVTLENGELVYGMDFNGQATDARDKVREFLMEKL